MSDLRYLHETPAALTFMASLRIATDDFQGAELDLFELIAWISFEAPRRIPRPPATVEIGKTVTEDEGIDLEQLQLHLPG